MPVAVKRVYESASRTDGARVLVDRLWPRGLNKSEVAADEWLRRLAPSDYMRKWFHAQPEKWTLFRKRYLKELPQKPKQICRRSIAWLTRGSASRSCLRPRMRTTTTPLCLRIYSTGCENRRLARVPARFEMRARERRRRGAAKRVRPILFSLRFSRPLSSFSSFI